MTTSANTQVAFSHLHNSDLFDNHKSRIANIENNTKEVEAKIEQKAELNKSVNQEIKTDKGKFSSESDSQLRKALMMQLNSPFPTLSTEVRLKAI